MTVTATSPVAPASSTGASAGSSSAASATDQSDRFVKLLVTQMQNQDPLNPMDSAQVTTQMAQISTVSGIDKLGTSIGALNTLMQQTQSLQAAALVGKNVQIAGQDLVAGDSGKASAGYDLAGPADSVVVTVTPLVSDRVSAVYADGGQLRIETDHHGVVAYADVKAVS